jgi:leader peptidase (prepilin peptidase)/N-methyltransferase
MLYFKFKITPIFFIYIFLFLSLIIITVIDLEHQIIPDVITLPGIILGLLINFFLGQGLINYLIGSLVGGGLFFLVAVMSKGGMGGGDIKLISMLGAFLGWFNILLTILISSFLGAVIGLALIIIKKKKRKDPIPFGPFIALGAMIVIFWGRQLMIWYQHLFL